MTQSRPANAPPRTRILLPAAACAAIVGLFLAMSEWVRPYGPKPDPASQNYNLLVQGFQSGQLSLKSEIPPGFAQLADPLDPEQSLPYRGPPYWLHDQSYYRGRLYLYFGATPVVLLFWPWAAVTGRYLFQQTAVAFFLAAGFLAGASAILHLWRRYFPEVSPGVAAVGVAVLGLASGMPFLLQRAEFYEVAISCGCALTLLSLAFIWMAAERPAKRGPWLAAASLAFGLAVGARPAVLYGAVILLVPVAAAWRQSPGGPGRWGPWASLAAALVPISLCGLGIMLYNFLRFGSAFEFGQSYQLAAEREGAMGHFSPAYLEFNLRTYFLEPARWSSSFPFHMPARGTLPPAGHMPVEDTFGVLVNLPILWLALAAPLAWRGREGLDRSTLRSAAGSAALLFGAGALTLGMYYWSCGRYEIEFIPALAILSVLGIFGLEQVLSDRPVLRVAVRGAWSLLLGLSAVFTLLQCVSLHAGQVSKFAQVLADSGQTQQAVSEFEHALRINPNLGEAHNNLANILAQMPGRMPEALDHYGQALRIDPGNGDTHYNLATQLAKDPGRLPEALTHLEETLRLDPDNFAAQQYAGIVCARLGRFDQAIAHFVLAVRVNPDSAEAHKNLAITYARIGQLGEALAHMAAAAKLDPSDGDAREKLRILQSMVR